MAAEELSDVLSEFARTMVTDFPTQAILDHLDPHHIAASNEAALRFEKLQTELSEGPRLAAYRTGEAISAPDLTREARFPLFCPRALDAGLVTEVRPADALRRHQSRR